MSKLSFAVIAHNTEQQCGFGLHYPPKNRILPLVWEPLLNSLQLKFPKCIMS